MVMHRNQWTLVAAGLSALAVIAGVSTTTTPITAIAQSVTGERPPHPLDAKEPLYRSPDQPCIATYASFSQIKTGDHEAVLRRKMGCMGEVISESKINFEKYTTVQWEGEDGFSIVHIMLKNRVVISKIQIGLKP
jgi:hypothetical protein